MSDINILKNVNHLLMINHAIHQCILIKKKILIDSSVNGSQCKL